MIKIAAVFKPLLVSSLVALWLHGSFHQQVEVICPHFNLGWPHDSFWPIAYNRHAAATAAAKLRQLCPTLCDPIDGSPSGSPIPGILQARVLEWDAIAFSDNRHDYVSSLSRGISMSCALLSVWEPYPTFHENEPWWEDERPHGGSGRQPSQ